MARKQYVKRAIQWARNRGISNIRADLEGYEQPTSYTKIDANQPFTPDVTGKRHDNKYYIEIATKTENVYQKVSKWKLLSTLARRKGGKLFLIAPKGHKAFTERVLKNHSISNAQLVYLPNM